MKLTEIVAYHTTSLPVGTRIAAGNDKLKIGKNEFDWLGSGVYFWVGNFQMARWWINTKKDDDPSYSGCILEYHITLGNCLDLSEAEHLLELRRYERAIDWNSIGSRPLNLIAPEGHRIAGEYKQRYLDHAIIDGYCQFQGDCFDTVIGIFESGPPVYHGAGQYIYNNAQLAVREKGLARAQFARIHYS